MFDRFSLFGDATAPDAISVGFGDEREPPAPAQSGLLWDEQVATVTGWRPAADIVPGDTLLTFDAGLQRVTKVSRRPLWTGHDACPRRFWPLQVPRGAMGNRDVMHLLPNQTIMIESDLAEDIYGDPFTLIPAAALSGLRGIHRVPPQDGAEIVHIHFADEQVIFARQGAMLLCPSSRDMLDGAMDAAGDPLYTILPMDQARRLAIELEEDVLMPERGSTLNILTTAFA